MHLMGMLAADSGGTKWRFEDEDGVVAMHPIPTDVTRAEALMWKRNPREAARIASSLNAAAADSDAAAELTDDEL